MYCFRYKNAYHHSNNEVKLYLALSITLIGVFIGRIFYAIYDYYLTGFDPALKLQYVLWNKMGLIFQGCAFGALIIIFELQQFQGNSKFFFSIGYFITIILGVILPYSLTQYITIIANVFLIFIVYGFVSMIIKSEGVFRRRAINILLGFVLYLGASFLMTTSVELYLSPILNLSLYSIHTIIHLLKILAIHHIGQGYL